MEHFTADNARRRWLCDFERAKCAVKLKEIAEERKRGRGLTRSQSTIVRESVRESIGNALGIGPRQVSRLLRVFETPSEVQEAMRLGGLSLTDVNKIASWPTAKQNQLAEFIASGREPKAAIRELTPSEPQTANGTNFAFHKFLGQIEQADVALRSNSGNLRFCAEGAEADREVLERGSMLIGALLNGIDDFDRAMR